jgi:uncharacterized protein (TIGR00730 family)
MERIAVFCGASPGINPAYAEAARQLGALLGRRGLGLVYGGGQVGMMGVIADAVLAAGGQVIGVMPRNLFPKEIGHPGLTELRAVGSMHERKALMADLADGFIALPGGYGTLDEFCEIVTWAQLGLHRKPCGLLNAAGYFTAFLGFLDHARGEGFIQPQFRELVLADDQPERLLDRLAAYQPPTVRRWLEQDQR